MSLPRIKDYSLERIGAGSFSTVYKALNRNGLEGPVAIKCVSKLTVPQSTLDNLIMEIKLLKVLKHENIVEMRDFFWDERYIYIVMEYCNGGDLSNFIKLMNPLDEKVCQKFLQQLALAMKYLREHNICHMDLKPHNLLLMRRPELVLKIADFGLAQYLSTTERRSEVRGSLLYMAPEILLHRKYDARVDLWSVGVILYECLFGKVPYSSNNSAEFAKQMTKPIKLPKNRHISVECEDLLTRLLKHNPDTRLSFEEFFNHDFVDLEHAPSKDNYIKAVGLAQKAVKMDKENCQIEAYHLYCESLRYFIPIVTNETDFQKKEMLRVGVNEYIKRAKQLKDMYMSTTTTAESANFQPVSRCDSLEGNAAINFQELCTLSKSTPGMPAALEIGEAAEQYLAENNYEVALQKFQSSLKLLIRFLADEPSGRRKDLLTKQVYKWIKVAESTKSLLISEDMEKSAEQKSESQDFCSLQ